MLGIMKGMKYKSNTISVEAGDRILLYTDGVTEAHDPEAKLYGDDRLIKVFTENIGLVEVEITTAEGSNVYYTMRNTPNGIVYNIPGTGDFVVTFTLENGDEYYGEFTITE